MSPIYPSPEVRALIVLIPWLWAAGSVVVVAGVVYLGLKLKAGREKQLVAALKAALDDFVDISEYWNGNDNNRATSDACVHNCKVADAAIAKIKAVLNEDEAK